MSLELYTEEFYSVRIKEETLADERRSEFLFIQYIAISLMIVRAKGAIAS